MRSILTCLGIIIGVAAVITMMEIGRALPRASAIPSPLSGADNIIVWPGTAQTGGVSQGLGSVVTLHPRIATPSAANARLFAAPRRW